MDPSLTQSDPSVEEQEDDWDTDGFVIPSLTIGDSDLIKQDVLEGLELTDVKPPPKVIKEEEKIYLGPYGAPPSQAKQQQLDLNRTGRKQRFKQKLKEADRKYFGTVGRENKVEHIRELVGNRISNRATTSMMPNTSPRDWLDPHCHESQFERFWCGPNRCEFEDCWIYLLRNTLRSDSLISASLLFAWTISGSAKE